MSYNSPFCDAPFSDIGDLVLLNGELFNFNLAIDTSLAFNLYIVY